MAIQFHDFEKKLLMGIEPTTFCLQDKCSTIELKKQSAVCAISFFVYINKGPAVL